MDLWIRSQDKDIFIKVDNLLIDDEVHHIYTHNCINNMQMSYTLGRYETRERALEVLDEIQKRRRMLNLIPYLENLHVPLWNRVDEFLDNEKDIFTYEMPKE